MASRAVNGSSDNTTPVMKQDCAETTMKWGFVALAITAIGLLAAAGYFGYTLFSQGLNMFHSLPFTATFYSGMGTGLLALALRVGACCRSRSVIKQEQAMAEARETRKGEILRLFEDNGDRHFDVVKTLTKEEYGELLDGADKEPKLTERLAQNRKMLIANLSTARTEAVKSVANTQLLREFFAHQFLYEIDSTTFSKDEKTERLRTNIDAIKKVFSADNKKTKEKSADRQDQLITQLDAPPPNPPDIRPPEDQGANLLPTLSQPPRQAMEPAKKEDQPPAQVDTIDLPRRKPEHLCLYEVSDDPHTDIVQKLSPQDYGQLLDDADRSEVLAKRLATHHTGLIANLSTARTEPVLAVAKKFGFKYDKLSFRSFTSQVEKTKFLQTPQLEQNIKALQASIPNTEFGAPKMIAQLEEALTVYFDE